MGGEKLEPFLKWAGGKRWLVDAPHFSPPKKIETYYEPFLGGAAVFLALKPARAVLSDINPQLIEVYESVARHPGRIVELLQIYHEKHSPDLYYAVRDQNLECPLERAARFLYLNRTCWNGLYRVNKSGKFNVPIGTKSKVLSDSDRFFDLSEVISRAELNCCDFEIAIDRAKDGDFVFCDPPYTTAHNNNCFIKYNENLFSWSDQVRLAQAAFRAKERGATVVITNAAHESVLELYEGASSTKFVTRQSVISGLASGRSRTEELIVTV